MQTNGKKALVKPGRRPAFRTKSTSWARQAEVLHSARTLPRLLGSEFRKPGMHSLVHSLENLSRTILHLNSICVKANSVKGIESPRLYGCGRSTHAAISDERACVRVFVGLRRLRAFSG